MTLEQAEKNSETQMSASVPSYTNKKVSLPQNFLFCTIYNGNILAPEIAPSFGSAGRWKPPI